MAEEGQRLRLGRGLAALIGDMGDDDEAVVDRGRGQRRVPIEFLRPNPRNPRKTFAESDLEDLAQSIRERGIIQPIVVRSLRGLEDAFEIIAGERRWRAAQRAGLHEVPIVVVEADDRLALEYAIVENVQRTDLNALEEAAGYDKLIADFGYSQTELAQVIGKSRSHVANTLRLMKLPQSVQDKLSSGLISAGHARALLAVKDPEAAAERIVERGLNVRDVERLAREEEAVPGSGARGGRPRSEKDADTRALEQALTETLGLEVSIAAKPSAPNGEVRIRYASLEQLDMLCRALRGGR
ncbi:ParB/RepB/Spo0J family partition protein [Salinarimonas ramus]|uniref:Chromosome partitioning protein ParB n=1 Tax=Salinarimonas ramus TaxID=690164 RepID=A0A917Q8D1_9HYPH|nr:ParB/RepB/Spo0J family partition protein [Salinarimonas ramus]GGK34587.1 chromosome partitioning protein ParB [Salinarimonas ramus]